MKCNACKYEFCWLCTEKYTPDHYNYTRATPCSGRMFTDVNSNQNSCLCCKIIFGLIIYLMLPIFILLILLFIVPIKFILAKFDDTRKRTIRINNLARGDNRFIKRDFNSALKAVGCCKILLYSLISIIIFPLVMIIAIIPFVIFLLIWIFFFFIILYRNIAFLYRSCCRSRPTPQIQREHPNTT